MSTGYVESLEPEECRRLLASRAVGRVAFTRDDGEVLVLPIAYVIDDDGVLVFATSPESILSRLVGDTRATVQIDDVAEDLQNGWSVLAHGHADLYEGAAVPRPWVPGHDKVLVGVRFDDFSGRAVSVDE